MIYNILYTHHKRVVILLVEIFFRLIKISTFIHSNCTTDIFHNF